MLKKYLTLALAVLAINLSFGVCALAETTKETKAAKRVVKVKKAIAKLGSGRDAKVKVKLNDGTKIRGFVTRVADDQFEVTDEKTGMSTTVPYKNAKQVSSGNDNWNWLIGLGVAAGVILLIGLL